MRGRAALVAALLCGGAGAASFACSPAGPRPGAVETAQPKLTNAPTTAQESAEAASLLSRARDAYSAGRMGEADSLASVVVERYPATSASVPALLLSARAAEAEGDLESAAERAGRYAALFPPGDAGAEPARALAQRAREELERRRSARPVLGVILPGSGSAYLQRYGDLILQGVNLAMAGGEAEGAVRLVVADDSGQPGDDPERLQELEREGAVVVVGPLLGAGVRAAAEARLDTSLVIVTPTAADALDGLPNVYSLAAPDPSEAEALARYAVSHGLGRVALLYPRMAGYTAAAAAFAATLTAAGGEVSADVAYDSAATTFETWVTQVLASRPQAVFVPAPDRDVRQLAPQLRYYGLDPDSVQVLGTDTWTTDAARRTLKAAGLTGVVAATPMLRSASGSGWQAFKDRYEQAERRTLDNPYPALGYDAALLALRALEGTRGDAAAVAARMRHLEAVRGALGTYSVEGGMLRRTPILVRVEAEELVPVGDAGAPVPSPGGAAPDTAGLRP